MVKRLLRWVGVIKPGDDTGPRPVQQVFYLGKTADAIMVFPYGMHANVDGEAPGLMIPTDGNLEGRPVLPTSMTRRSVLGSGDVELYSPVSRSRVTIRANGDVEVDAVGNLIATVAGDASCTVGGNADVTVSGDMSADVTGAITVQSGGNTDVTVGGTLVATVTGTATVTAPTITLNGNVVVTGTFSMSGGGTADFGTGTITHNGKVIDSTHGHVQGNDSGGDTEAAINGVT